MGIVQGRLLAASPFLLSLVLTVALAPRPPLERTSVADGIASPRASASATIARASG